jgi:lipopolysaccharide transport system permease protein
LTGNIRYATTLAAVDDKIGKKKMLHSLRELIVYRELLFMITWREIKVKYKQSVLGFMWAILMPLIIVSAGMLVKYAFSLVSGKPIEFSDIASLSVKAIPWAFFVSSIRFATTSLIGNINLITKIYMPREVFPIASLLSQLVDLGVATIALTMVLTIGQVGISVHLIWVPILLVLLVVFSMGVGMIVSAASLFFRDVKYLVDVFVTFAIFFTPVFYEAEMFGKWASVLLLNPVAPILEGLNDAVVYHRMPQIGWVVYSAVASAVTLTLGSSLFRKLEPAFAESV